MQNRITSLFKIQYPLVQAGMIWCSGWELASAVSNAGGLGIIGSGSMYPNILEEHIIKCKAATNKPFAVNLPMLYPNIEDHIALIIKHEVPIVFTSAGNPKTYTARLKEQGITVVHVVSSAKFAKKAQDAGVDAIVAEGFEAGGHNGRDETTTFCLIPMVKAEVEIPLIAAGGIGTGRGMLAAMNLGADGVQIGSRFVASPESSAHQNFKQVVLDAREGDTMLTLKELTPVRLVKNAFYNQVHEAYEKCASAEELNALLGRGRAKRGMFEGDLNEGELEIGQVAGLIHEIKPAAEIVQEIITEFKQALAEQTTAKYTF
ncbi:MAG: 2-nitropropane dioxygenase [Candidatus Fluviicola riflensis]|nr:MAG: nitronate monooxygenase [Candidatus Fluviicola riflensis]OGS78874.1 MAG: 2-nitropropane dioxygenase [Candidatus Fluviicola riflensis]OGS85896.1 MAG: 2-nitropropane dioxygenase [Fluviicola sp. RIFCSPHIGHO2_12_FULL_43_24]OGS86305.1 MAG: 2-nitropropane dioxygenase [Fluviicola sp. RIFCSPHIGHO2_01_FULL_43_53]